MAEIIDIRDYIKKRDVDLFQSGDMAEPGHYVDISSNSVITLYVEDELPSEFKMVRLGRQYRRFETAHDARSYIQNSSLKQQAA